MTELERRLRPLTGKQMLAADLRLQNPCLSEAKIAQLAEYSTGQAVKYALSLPSVKAYMSKRLDMAGATLEASAKVVAEAHQAEKVEYFVKDGKVCDERRNPDHRTRLLAAELSMKAHGALDEPAVQVNHTEYNFLSDEQLVMIALGEKRVSDFTPTQPGTNP